MDSFIHVGYIYIKREMRTSNLNNGIYAEFWEFELVWALWCVYILPLPRYVYFEMCSQAHGWSVWTVCVWRVCGLKRLFAILFTHKIN